jgi:hypothetical protein
VRRESGRARLATQRRAVAVEAVAAVVAAETVVGFSPLAMQAPGGR